MDRKATKARHVGNRTRGRNELDDGEAFLPDVVRTHSPIDDDVAESFAEEFIATTTSAESVGEDARDEWSTDEVGGPFIEMQIQIEADLGLFANNDEEAAA